MSRFGVGKFRILLHHLSEAVLSAHVEHVRSVHLEQLGQISHAGAGHSKCMTKIRKQLSGVENRVAIWF